MAVVDLKSEPITNRDADLRVKNNPEFGGRLKEQVGHILTNATDTTASTFRFFELPSNARISQLLIYSDDSGTVGLMDVGLYRTTFDGSAVVDADLFASALDINNAALNGVDITHESGEYALDESDKPIWNVLGLTSDPNLMYDLVGTLTATLDAATDIKMICRYTS